MEKSEEYKVVEKQKCFVVVEDEGWRSDWSYHVLEVFMDKEKADLYVADLPERTNADLYIYEVGLNA